MITGLVQVQAVATASIDVVAVTIASPYDVVAGATTDAGGNYAIDLGAHTDPVAVIVIPPAGYQPKVVAPVYDGGEANFSLTDDTYVVPDAAAVDFALSSAPAAPLAITVQPQGEQILEGESVSLSVAATGDELMYQWLRDGLPIPGETGAALTDTPASTAVYHVIVYDADDSVVSAAALVTVTPVLVVVSQPSPVTAQAESVATFSVSVSGTPPYSYQWHGPSGPVGSGQDFLSVTVYPSGEGDYYCVITDATGQEVTTSTAALTVTYPAITILQDIYSTSAVGHYQFEVSANGGFGGLLYEWYQDGSKVGEGSKYLAAEEGVYQCQISDGYGNVESSALATLTLLDVALDDDTEPMPATTPPSPARITYRAQDWAAMMAAADREPTYVIDYEFSGRIFKHRDRLLNPKT